MRAVWLGCCGDACAVPQDETGQRMEITEIPDHPFYIGTQYHPEYKSRLAGVMI